MTCHKITLSLLIKDNAAKIMFVTYLGIYCQGQTLPPIVLLKGKNMIVT